MDEKKVYGIIGKVEIGTDEYRDLIEQAIEFRKQMEEYRSEKWKAESETKKAKDALKDAEDRLQKINEFLKQDKDLFLRFQMWLLGEEKNA